MYKGRIIDVDVHHTWASDDELIAYLPSRWRDYFDAGGGRRALSVDPPSFQYSRVGGTTNRLDSMPVDGSRPGSDYETMRQQLLDPLHIERAILSFNIGYQPAFHNPTVAVELCRAANEWSMDRWLDRKDDRLYGAVLAPTVVPEEAAKEITRCARHSRMAVVLLVVNPFSLPFGHPVYHSIYQAAAENGLPVAIHVGSGRTNKNVYSPGGRPLSRLEEYVLFEQPAVAHTASLIAQGVFEKFRDLKVVLTENGFMWIPWLLWSLDARYSLLKRESPHMRRLPSEYFRDHIWASSQPFDHTAGVDQVFQLLDSFGGMEDKLCFASDYPHWDADEPARVATHLPKSWRDKLFAENALKLFNWTDSTTLRTATQESLGAE